MSNRRATRIVRFVFFLPCCVSVFGGAAASTTVAAAQIADFGDRDLGWLSELYESNFRGPGTVSPGVGDPGGVSYGTYQLSANAGTVQKFVAKYYPEQFRDLTPGTDAFTKKWLEITDSDGDSLASREYAFVKNSHYDPIVRSLDSEFHINMAERSLALRNVVFSTAVQHGPNSRLPSTAIRNILQRRSLGDVTDEDLINAIYDERGAVRADGNLKYFSKSSPRVRKSVARRLKSERTSALCMLAIDLLRKERDAQGLKKNVGQTAVANQPTAVQGWAVHGYANGKQIGYDWYKTREEAEKAKDRMEKVEVTDGKYYERVEIVAEKHEEK